MNDVSVLLNLTGRLVFEKVNPLMDLVSGHGPFLFYDQLSLERFPMDQEEQEDHVRKLLINLRNLLGGRCLSADDQGGKIRIIVTMDLVGGFAHQSRQVWFPAQKARDIIEMINQVFERDTQLRSRFLYSFIFMEWDSDDRASADFYRSLAYDGCYGQPSDWLTSEMMVANTARDEAISRMKSPSVELRLDDGRIQASYAEFQKALNEQEVRVAAVLERAGVAETFRNALAEGMKGVRTVGDFRNFDFDSHFRATISELIGLCSSTFGDCQFFIFKMRTDTISHRKKDEMVFYSLLQLLGSIAGPWNARLSIVDGSMNEHSLNAEAMMLLKREVSSYLSKMKEDGELRWSKNERVKYCVYSEINTKSTESTEHYEHNEEVDERREALYNDFCELRRVPFFFGSNSNDWEWYTNVSEKLDEIYAYEVEHDRPRYTSPGRITEKEMKVTPDETTYADLEEKRRKLESGKTGKKFGPDGHMPGNLLSDLKTFQEGREKGMADFVKYKEELKKEMVKLGFASITFRLSVVVCLIITLCYAFHFIYTGQLAESIWIGACLGAVVLICGVAAMISQSRFKSVIKAVFVKIDGCLNQMKKQRQQYFGNINNRISHQNEADIKRRNLEEITAKLELFKSHNMQVDLWKNHFAYLEEKLTDMLDYTDKDKAETAKLKIENKTDADNLQVETIPCLPISVCKKFQSMKVSLTQQGCDYKDVTCFLKSLNVTFVNNV